MTKRYSAFTLIELLVAVAIIGILTSLATVSYSGVQKRGRDAQRKNDLNQVKIALSTYYNAQIPASYVTAATKVTINNTDDTLSTALKPSYIKELPLDPVNTGDFRYKYRSLNSAADFELYATLENRNDKNGWAGGTAWTVDGLVIENE